MIRRIVAYQPPSTYLILVRPDDTFIDEERIDDMAILADLAAGFRRPVWPLHSYLKFGGGYWQEMGHSETILQMLMELPEQAVKGL